MSAELQHQRIDLALARLLQDAAPDDVEVLLPVDVRLSPFRQIAPDVTVVGRQERAAKRVTDVPLLELVDGEYEQVAQVRGDQAYEAQRPFPVRVVPGALSR